MNTKIPGNFANVQSLGDLTRLTSEGFRVLENLLSAFPNINIVQSAKDAYPAGPGNGDLVIDMTSQPYTFNVWNGKIWVQTVTGSNTTDDPTGGGDGTGGDTTTGISDAPDDGTLYGRKSEEWTAVPAAGIADAPLNTNLYARKNGAWVVVPPATVLPTTGFEILVSDQVDNPPEMLYNDNGGTDFLYSDSVAV